MQVHKFEFSKPKKFDFSLNLLKFKGFNIYMNLIMNNKNND